ncbi:hypothetical protein FVEN_g3988 [Fusarium venenatum]|uniref:Uncharacterized protein n=1 Tax=Fusarium venenatum TaxID=56646 RepID=A0A2L2TGM6_9HYPO|nr:uncharacterized protein FVRRES_09335 [Fusarium venenatum]KAG8358229.1 hypothetical protein FVEN_g3988 [Fusarium venenatum]KAH6966024.1 hypothetical protein EDB82DRAFT_514550 [Fusarium venenatum]CEI69258.1 unnamed protein product [Fusarium venenatum]
MRVTLFILSSISAITKIAASTALPIPVSEEVPPIINPIVDPIVESIIEPAVEPVAEPVVESIVEPAIEQDVEPVVNAAVDPIIESIIEPIIDPVVELAIEPAVETVIEQVVEPAVEPIIQPVVEPIVEPIIEPAVEPIVDPIIQPGIEPAVEPVIEPVIELVSDPIGDPIIDSIVEPVIEPIIEPVAELAVEPVFETIVEPIDPIVDQIPVPETPSRISTGVIPEDLKNAMQGIQSLASDLILQASNIGGDGVKVQVIGNTFLHCQDMVDRIQEISSKISRPPTILFGWEDQGAICSAFDTFGINQTKLVTVLSMEPQSIVRDGFGDRFQECFDLLRPVLSLFIKQLIIYTPTCEAEMLRRIDQLDVAFSNAKMRIEDARQS